jgi:methylmalonyl-CoA epimerase
MIKGIYGVNIAVRDLEKAVEMYERLFGVKSVPLGEGDFAFSGLVGAKLEINGTFISLVSPTDENTAVAKFLETRGEGVFLLSVEVDNIDADVEKMRNEGLNFVLKDNLGGNYGSVNFAHPKSAHGVQLEIYQPNR